MNRTSYARDSLCSCSADGWMTCAYRASCMESEDRHPLTVSKQRLSHQPVKAVNYSLRPSGYATDFLCPSNRLSNIASAIIRLHHAVPQLPICFCHLTLRVCPCLPFPFHVSSSHTEVHLAQPPSPWFHLHHFPFQSCSLTLSNPAEHVHSLGQAGQNCRYQDPSGTRPWDNQARSYYCTRQCTDVKCTLGHCPDYQCIASNTSSLGSCAFVEDCKISGVLERIARVEWSSKEEEEGGMNTED